MYRVKITTVAALERMVLDLSDHTADLKRHPIAEMFSNALRLAE